MSIQRFLDWLNPPTLAQRIARMPPEAIDDKILAELDDLCRQIEREVEAKRRKAP